MAGPSDLHYVHAEVKEEVKEEDIHVPQTDYVRYAWSSTMVEEHTAEFPATWGVAFNYRPCVEHMEGRTLFWKRLVAEQESEDDSEVDRNETKHNSSRIGIPAGARSSYPWRHMFATVNGGSVRVYLASIGERPQLLRHFDDPDERESLYAVKWTFNADNRSRWWVLAAGERGVVRMIDVLANRVVRTLSGHGGSINDMDIHPRDPALLLTASKDESLRMWNLRTGATIAVFCGLKGHRGEVVSVDFDAKGFRFASCGIDNSVRVWDVMSDEGLVEAIGNSHRAADCDTLANYKFEDGYGRRSYTRFIICQFPRFLTRTVHKNYIDCVMWVGDMLLSKSVRNRLMLIEPSFDREALSAPATEYTVLQEYIVHGCDVWFIRFGMDRERRTVAIGNEKVCYFADVF